MKIPTITGIIRRRLLLNYRVAPEVVQAVLPSCFRPKVVGSHAIAGICLIRLEEIRPKGLPGLVGLSSENSAHRIAVEWEGGEGVFVPRRDTDSRLNSLAGGRLFAGEQHHSRFLVRDEGGAISLRVEASGFEQPLVDVQAGETDEFPGDSVFGGLEESSRFFEAGCVGYSARDGSCGLDGMKLEVGAWHVSPLRVELVRSAYFDDEDVFPADSIAFDHGLLMRDIAHEWHTVPALDASERKSGKGGAGGSHPPEKE